LYDLEITSRKYCFQVKIFVIKLYAAKQQKVKVNAVSNAYNNKRYLFRQIVISSDVHIACQGYLQFECRICDILFAYENVSSVLYKASGSIQKQKYDSYIF